jgi:hypothetical protein
VKAPESPVLRLTFRLAEALWEDMQTEMAFCEELAEEVGLADAVPANPEKVLLVEHLSVELGWHRRPFGRPPLPRSAGVVVKRRELELLYVDACLVGQTRPVLGGTSVEDRRVVAELLGFPDDPAAAPLDAEEGQ